LNSRPLSRVTVPLPSSVAKITRNMRGNTNVKKAAAGFRQKALFV
jgi:hypothetical protein